MSNFVDIGDKELVGIEIVVDSNLLYLTVATVPEISQFAATAFRDGEMKRVFLPQIPAILQGIHRNFIL